MSPRNSLLKRRTDHLLDGGDLPSSGSTGSGKMFGLSANFPELLEIPIKEIVRNLNQPRKAFDESDLAALAASIERHGLQNPIIVTRTGRNEYLLVGGERRLRAHELLERETIFAIVTKGEADEIALIDNVMRVDLNAVELAQALARLGEIYGYTHEQLGKVIGRDQSDITKILSILRLPPTIVDAYLTAPQSYSRSILIEIAAVDDPEHQAHLWQAATGGATVRDVRQAKRARTTDAAPVAERAGGSVAIRKRVASGLSKVEKTVKALAADAEHLDERHRQRLRTLKDMIDGLLG